MTKDEILARLSTIESVIERLPDGIDILDVEIEYDGGMKILIYKECVKGSIEQALGEKKQVAVHGDGWKRHFVVCDGVTVAWLVK